MLVTTASAVVVATVVVADGLVELALTAFELDAGGSGVWQSRADAPTASMSSVGELSPHCAGDVDPASGQASRAGSVSAPDLRAMTRQWWL